MTKEELIKILQDDSTIVKDIDINNVYIIQTQIDIDMSKEEVGRYLDSLSDALKELGLKKFLLVPIANGLGELIFREVKQDE